MTHRCRGTRTRLAVFLGLLLFLGFLWAHEYSARKVFAMRVPISIGQQHVSVRVADRFVDRARGLMECEQLLPDEGMLFVFDIAEEQRFGMKDTPLPLDVGFFDSNGVLLEVRSLAPFDETVIKASQPALFALEVNQGWFSRHEVRPGAVLDLRSLSRR